MRLGGAFEEQELSSKASRAQGPVCIYLEINLPFYMFCLNQVYVPFQQNVERLVEEVQEARKIKRMHQPTKVQLQMFKYNFMILIGYIRSYKLNAFFF